MSNRVINFVETALIGLFLIIGVAFTLGQFPAVIPQGHVIVSEPVASVSGTDHFGTPIEVESRSAGRV